MKVALIVCSVGLVMFGGSAGILLLVGDVVGYTGSVVACATWNSAWARYGFRAVERAKENG